jgi:hypothetical protein
MEEDMSAMMEMCEGGRCGPILTADDDPEVYDPMVLGPVPNGHQYGYCPRCFTGYRWSMVTQSWTPWHPMDI